MIVNNRLGGDFEVVRGTAPAVVMRSISTLIRANARGNVVSTAAFAARHGSDFCMTSIGTDFEQDAPKPYDRAYMNRLFEYGFKRGQMASFCEDPRLTEAGSLR